MLPTGMNVVSAPTTLADRVRTKRKEKGWTQEQFAEATGSNQAAIQKIENGKSLHPRHVVQLAEALQVSPAWLMFGHASIEEELDEEALEMAKAWSKLAEPHRSSLKRAVVKIAAKRSAAVETEVDIEETDAVEEAY